MTPAEAANLPRYHGQRGHYEAWFLELMDGSRSSGLSLRFALRIPKDPKEAPTAELWACFHDHAAPARSFGLKHELPLGEAHLSKDRFSVGIGAGTLEHYGSRGTIERDGHTLRWDLSWSEDLLFSHLPFPALYQRRYPRTKILAPHANLIASGRFWVDGDEHRLEHVRGVQAHQWGETHPRRWIWCQVPGFVEDPEASLECLTADVAMGPLRLPPLTLHVLRYKGEVLALNRVQDVLRKNESRTDAKLHLEDSYALGRWTVGGGNERLRFHGEVWADPERYLGLTYLDPDGSKRYVSRTKVGAARIEILSPDTHGGWRVSDTLHAHSWAAIEFGGQQPEARIRTWL
ncbi:MAG: hypothetical protein U1E65_17695 [Myxococcota bacterium]